jgi:rod shape-determining protein MreC
MQQLIAFFTKFGAGFLFVFLQIIAGVLYLNFNGSTEKMAFLSSANGVLANLQELVNKTTNYWNLGAVNDSLAKENARLKMQFPNAKYQSKMDTIFVQDSAFEQQYVFTAAKIVNNNLHHTNNYITLNRGSQHNIRPNSGVVSATSNGIVGIVKKVSNNYSVAMSIFHKETRISAKIKRNDYFGVLQWNGIGMTHLDLESLPKHASIQKGDSIVTSGYSNIFPEDIFVGTVDTFFSNKSSSFFTVKVRLAADVSNMQQVYIVTDLMQTEKKNLEEAAKYE